MRSRKSLPDPTFPQSAPPAAHPDQVSAERVAERTIRRMPTAGGPVTLGARDRAVLDALTRRVRVLTLEQLARVWWRGDHRAARSRLRELERAGWVRSLDLLAHPILELVEPAASWSPSRPAPIFTELAHRLGSRWKLPPRVHRAVVATTEAGVRLAGHGGRVPRPAEASHDIHLTEVYLRLLRADPDLAKTWLSEEELYSQGYGRGTNLPDAMVLAPGNGAVPTVIEFGGAYRASKLEQFHRFCQRRSLPYEVW